MADHKHVFISYARADAHYAERLEYDLRASGFATWRDTRNLDPSQDFTGEIEEAIRAASHVVVCLTSEVKRRADSWVRRESAYALARHEERQKQDPVEWLPIIPVVFPGGELPALLSTRIAIFVEHDEDYPRCLAEILMRLHRRGGPTEQATYADPPELVAYLNALHEWTSTRLQESVHTLITLAAADTPNAIEGRPAPTFTFNFAVSPVLAGETQAPSMPVTSSEPPPAESLLFLSFAEAFRYHGRRVLLLGAPGAGKTTTLLAFARDAAVERLNDPTQPVPVLASIHTWDHQTPISEWAQGQAQGVSIFARKCTTHMRPRCTTLKTSAMRNWVGINE